MKILITVKAYPAISTKYGETVCTAGVTEEGKWIRIYPVPFRKLDYTKRFKKYEWVELDLVPNQKDFRPETFRPYDLTNIKTLGNVKADGGDWHERRKYVLNNVYTSMSKLIEDAKDRVKIVSLATFKPAKFKDFIYEETDREWKKNKIQKLESQDRQGALFEAEDEDEIKEFEIVNKLPYKFKFIFEDDEGHESKMMIEDWETGMLYWNSLIKHNGDEKKACQDVRKRYFDDFVKTKDYYFFLGTTLVHHYTARNPFVIIGDFRPKFQTQSRLF